MSRALLCLVLGVAGLRVGCAQEVLWRWGKSGTFLSDRFGTDVSGAGDVDADGIPDIVISSTTEFQAWVYSGRDGSLIRQHLDGAGPAFELGKYVDAVGDVDGDGHDDYLVGAQISSIVFSGRTGERLLRLRDISTGKAFGWGGAGLGDVDGDGVVDVVVGAANRDHPGVVDSAADVYSGSSGVRLYSATPPTFQWAYAWALADAGDVNADGVPDLLVGSPQERRGTLRVLSGPDGQVLLKLRGPSRHSDFSDAVGGLGDLNADGYADFAVGAPAAGSAEEGMAFVYSGRDGATLWSYQGEAALDRFGDEVRGPGDVNGDGVPDFLISAPGNDRAGPAAGSVCLYSGADGQLLYRFNGAKAGDRFGSSLRELGDVDGDGLNEFVVGAPYGGPGEVFVYRGSPVYVQAQPDRAAVGGTVDLALAATEANAPAVLLVNTAAAPDCPCRILEILALDGGGRAHRSLTVPPSAAGLSYELQAFVLCSSGEIVASAVEVVSVQ